MWADAEGVVEFALLTLALVGGFWLLAHAVEAATLGRSGARRTWFASSTRGIPDGLPIERIAADIRRIRPQARHLESGMPMARRIAIVAAYDEALMDACRALDVPTDLDRIVDSLERESERLRTEVELERAGVDLG
jgi:hypothetical protein